MFSPYEFGQVMAGFCNAVRAAPSSPLDGVPNQLEQLLRENRTMSENMTKLLNEQAQLRADVTAQTTVINSATTALVGLTKQLAAAEDAARAAGVTDEQIAGFKSLRTTLESNTALLAAAIPANTPAAVSTETGDAITTESGAPVSADPAPTEQPAPATPSTTTAEPTSTSAAPAEIAPSV